MFWSQLKLYAMMVLKFFKCCLMILIDEKVVLEMIQLSVCHRYRLQHYRNRNLIQLFLKSIFIEPIQKSYFPILSKNKIMELIILFELYTIIQFIYL